MPKSRSKVKKTIIRSTLIELSDEFDLSICCSNRNCPSHWHNRLTEKLKTLQQNKSKTTDTVSKNESKPAHYQLSYPDILTKLFQLNENEENQDEQEIYSKPIHKSILLNKHNLYLNQINKRLNDLTYTFNRINLNIQLNNRMILLDNNSPEFDQMKILKINQLCINHLHKNSYLSLKIISIPIWNRSAVHVIVQDDNTHCIRLSLYNWLYVNETRQIKSLNYIQERLKTLLPINSMIILLEPWLKKCSDGDISLRCDSPNTQLILKNLLNNNNHQYDVEQLRQLGNNCYQADDNLSAIQYYTIGLKQLEQQQEKELTLKGQSIGPKTDEREQHRIRFLSNRCACYLRERHAGLALADTSILLTFNEHSPILDTPRITTGKLLFRCLNAHLQLGLYDKLEGLLKTHKFAIGLSGVENPTSMSILEKELIRLKNEVNHGRYDIEYMLNEQINNKSQMMFIDTSHHHAECQREDLFEIRQCQQDELIRKGYSKDSYGVYALKDLDIGTLLIVEQPFASIDNRIYGEDYSYSINYLKKLHSNIEFYSNDTIRLFNEIEKQLIIGNTTQTTFEKIKFMQPIRQWLMQNSNKQQQSSQIASDALENYEQLLTEKNNWRKLLIKDLPSSSSPIPWHVLFKTQQQNPYKSQSTLGLYPLSSMFNHSCLPNCLWYLIGDYLFIYVCSSNVRQGDELTISYCPLWISSTVERQTYLEQYDIHSCQCLLCLYDRKFVNEYESELKKFRHLRALVRQKNSTDINRLHYFQQLKCQYEILLKTYADRPISFINEFIDLETITSDFQADQNTFLQRLSTVCSISNPISLFGTQIQLLINHLEQSASDVKQWKSLLDSLYDIYTFRCYSHSSNHLPEKTLKDYKQFFDNLFQTQTFISNEKKL